MSRIEGKRVLFVHYNIHSKERWGRIFPLAKAAAQCGYNVTLITTSAKKGVTYNSETIDNVKVISFKDIIPSLFFKKGFALVSLITRIFYVAFHEYDFVYSDCGECLNTGWVCKIAQWKGAVYMSEWGDLLGRGGFYDAKPVWFKFFYGRYYLWAELYFRKSADYTIVLSSMMKEHAMKRGIAEDKILIVPGGAISDIISYVYRPKSQLGISEDMLTLGYIGIDNGELQDLKPLIEALHDDRLKQKCKLVLFGKKIDEKYIENFQLRDVVIEKGWIDYYKDPSPLQCIDVFVLIKSQNLSLSAMGWPNKLGDYMAVGRPVLITPYGDITSFIEKNPKGFFLCEANANNIVNTLLSILDNKYDLKQMGLNNREAAVEQISWVARVKQFLP